MVTYVRDQTGRFQQRPHYKPEELDRECENVITGFLKRLYGEVRYPIDTEDLKKLIERDAEDLDVYADLSIYGAEVEGVTEFRPGRKPAVKIASTLTENERRENRLRTTLTHEWGHVHFHGYLWEVEPPAPDLLRQQPNRDKIICKRDTMIDARQTDWMEWQAGYVCGAILMPKTAVLADCRSFVEEQGLYGDISLQSTDGAALIARIATAFKVSEDASRVRLLKLGLVTEAAVTRSLFS
ncbi:MAG: ImmA/IrrE family metallo-endopeptidase [Planctomycetales bacterium]|nr:ImmA/IrrE family metallo-endopeptidase [Planctomycetales bacterium]